MPAKRIDPGGAHQHVVSIGPRSLLVCTATRLVAQANCPVAAAAEHRPSRSGSRFFPIDKPPYCVILCPIRTHPVGIQQSQPDDGRRKKSPSRL